MRDKFEAPRQEQQPLISGSKPFWGIPQGQLVIDSDTQQMVHDARVSFAKPVEAITLDEMIDAVQPFLSQPIDTRPFRANSRTLDLLRAVVPTYRQTEQAVDWLGEPLGATIIEVDDSLPDGVIKRGHDVVCHVKDGL